MSDEDKAKIQRLGERLMEISGRLSGAYSYLEDNSPVKAANRLLHIIEDLYQIRQSMVELIKQ